MTQALYGTDIISISDLTRAQIQLILTTAAQLKAKPAPQLLANKIIANCFYEPSTRTRLSFAAAALRLGGQVLGFDAADHTSMQKGESLHDSIKVISGYADLIVIRHPRDGAARLAAAASDKPVINAGDAANQHPTQALLDLFTIQECHPELTGLNIALVGDLKYSRTIHSLIQLLALFNIRLFLVAPAALQLPEPFKLYLKKHGIKFSLHGALADIMPKLDVLYLTRLQKERFNALELEQEHVPAFDGLAVSLLAQAKPNLKILHPLPRLQELPIEIDATPHAHYFQQAANGLWVRQALLHLLLNPVH